MEGCPYIYILCVCVLHDGVINWCVLGSCVAWVVVVVCERYTTPSSFVRGRGDDDDDVVENVDNCG